MKAKTQAAGKTISGAAKDGASIVNEAQRQASRAIGDARKEARKQARRRLVSARVAAARARAGTQAKASKASTKAVGAAGAVGLAAGYFLDPDSGKRRRNVARDRALAMIRRGADRTRREAEHRTNQVEGKVEAAKSATTAKEPAANDQALASA